MDGDDSGQHGKQQQGRAHPRILPRAAGPYNGRVTISVLVPAYNEAGGLAASLTSIRAAMAAFTARGWATELVVCDNNSTDATAAIARAHGAAVVFEPINQIGRARNVAAAYASGDWLVFVDADSHPPRGAVRGRRADDRRRPVPGRRQHRGDGGRHLAGARR